LSSLPYALLVALPNEGVVACIAAGWLPLGAWLMWHLLAAARGSMIPRPMPLFLGATLAVTLLHEGNQVLLSLPEDLYSNSRILAAAIVLCLAFLSGLAALGGDGDNVSEYAFAFAFLWAVLRHVQLGSASRFELAQLPVLAMMIATLASLQLAGRGSAQRNRLFRFLPWLAPVPLVIVEILLDRDISCL
jgi:hypothetical protein